MNWRKTGRSVAVSALLALLLTSLAVAIAFMNIPQRLGTFMVIGVMVLHYGIVVVPTVHYGVVTRFKKRTGRVLDEGWHFVIPFVDAIELFSYEVVTTSIKASFLTKNNLEVVVSGSAKWRPDRALLSSRFIEMSEKTITQGFEDTIGSELGIIGGTKNADAFIRQREAISFLINCVLRLSEPPHIEAGLAPEDRLEYYVANGRAIREKLAHESLPENERDRSHVENIHGIDVVEFALANVDFNEATKKSLELKKQTQERLKAEQLEFTKTLRMMKKLKDEGIQPQEALSGAQTSLGEAKRNVFSIEGLGQLFGSKSPKIFTDI